MEKIQWKVEGMDCTNCALTIRRYLEKQGMKEVKVNFATGDVSFDHDEQKKTEDLSKGISDLGYSVIGNGHNGADHAGHDHGGTSRFKFLSSHLRRFWFCLP